MYRNVSLTFPWVRPAYGVSDLEEAPNESENRHELHRKNAVWPQGNAFRNDGLLRHHDAADRRLFSGRWRAWRARVELADVCTATALCRGPFCNAQSDGQELSYKRLSARNRRSQRCYPRRGVDRAAGTPRLTGCLFPALCVPCWLGWL